MPPSDEKQPRWLMGCKCGARVKASGSDGKIAHFGTIGISFKRRVPINELPSLKPRSDHLVRIAGRSLRARKGTAANPAPATPRCHARTASAAPRRLNASRGNVRTPGRGCSDSPPPSGTRVWSGLDKDAARTAIFAGTAGDKTPDVRRERSQFQYRH